MQKLFVKKEQGFTLIEIMVSISIFTILMVMGIAALLSANTAHRRAEGLRSAVDSLNFIMDDIARSVRTGSTYHCDITYGTIDTPQDCSFANSIAIEGQDGDPTTIDDQIEYRIDNQTQNANGQYVGYIEKADYMQNFYTLSTPEVNIDPNYSGFMVMNSTTNGVKRPYVTIVLKGTIEYLGTSMPFAIQTTVSSRSD